MRMKPEIIPAILESSFDAIVEKIHRADDFFPRVQIDIIDGLHAPNQTWPYASGESVEDAVRRLHNLSIAYDLDLMVHEPEDSLAAWLESDVQRVIVHLSSTKRLAACARQVRDAGREVYVGVTVNDLLDGLQDVAEQIDGVQCMGIAEVGKQGEPFDERVFDLIGRVQTLCPSLPVAVDGGVSPLHIPPLLDDGVSSLVIGSALFRGDVDTNADAILASVS